MVSAARLDITDDQLVEVKRLERSPKTYQKVALRARIILKAVAGEPNNAIAADLDVSRPTVILWRERFGEHGIEGIIHDASTASGNLRP